ncbi:MAG: hypothetical protein H6865_06750 [Rhodospirillales bacterium]|nr:hypothetical protein [Alphaproteobacteria bacterium]MCB9987317.1 hypothetical protein [Rhodospirillales bacterium]USO07827.1 MAG: hypothetical protein H6866_00950 [Rhodospirillales bacterium]
MSQKPETCVCFAAAADPLSGAGGRGLVNALWLTEVSLSRDVAVGGAGVCGVPLENVDLFVKNANRYPSADFILWLDYKRINDNTRFWVGSFVYDRSLHGNIRICDLNSIPAYENEDTFSLEKPASSARASIGSVYVRADYARILVLDHCLCHTKDRAFIIYADMDCMDVDLNWAKETIAMHGIAAHDFGHGRVSHAYIGLDPRDRLVRKWFPDLAVCALKDARSGYLGGDVFNMFVEALRADGRFDGLIQVRKKLLPPLGHRLDPLPRLMELGIS